MGFCTAQDANAYLGGTGNGDDPVLGRLVDAASDLIRSYCNRDFDSQAYTFTTNGRGNTGVMLPQYPVTAVTSVVVDGQPVPLRTAIPGSGYVVDSTIDTGSDAGPGIVRLDGYSFTKGVQNVAISYAAGYAANSIPDDLVQACAEIAADMKRRGPRTGEVAKSIQGEVISYSQKDIPPQAKSILDQRKRVAPI